MFSNIVKTVAVTNSVLEVVVCDKCVREVGYMYRLLVFGT